MGHQLWRLLCP